VEIQGLSCQLDQDNLKFAPFLNITALEFSVDMAEYVITLVQQSEFPLLKKFSFALQSEALSWAEVEQLFCALSRCKACQTLEYIGIYSHPPAIQDHSVDTFTAIRRLFCFRQLQTLHVSIRSSVCLDNDLLLEAMSSWPHIRCLELRDRHLPRQPAVTFRGLFAALRLCPQLDTLQLPIDTVNIDINPEAESFQHPSLLTLCICCSHVAHAEVVARIIFFMLPSVVGIAYPGGHVQESQLSAYRATSSHLTFFRSSAVFRRNITG